MFTSPANMFLSPRPRPKGAMREMPNLLEAEDIETIGASVVTDLTWKQIFDTDACTICGRCTSVCPANITGKPLDPREMVIKTGEVAASVAGGLPAGLIVGGARRRRAPLRPGSARRGFRLRGMPRLRRDLPGQHRDPRPDPRHAPVPDADGIGVPERAGPGLRVHGESGQPLGTEPPGPSRLDEGARLRGPGLR